VSLQDNEVFDVEIIVFAYKTALPNFNTYRNKPIYDDSQALNLQYKPEHLNFIIQTDPASEIEPEIQGQPKEYTVSINTEENKNQALVWFEHPPEELQLTAIWNKLSKQQHIIPLVHRAWRQVETPFNDPTYVNIKTDNNLAKIEQENDPSDGELLNPDLYPNLDFGLGSNQTPVHPDFSLSGMVALSKGRFMHFGHKLNLFRVYHPQQDNIMENMVFSLSERKQIKTGELHYFDSPWFGSIVKITAYTGAQENDKTPQ
jgi:hypothetical protein